MGPLTRSNDWGSSSSNGERRSPSSIISAFCWRGPSCRVAKDGVDSYDMTESAELRIVVGCSFMGIREDSMFCGTALDVRDILRVRDCCMSGVPRPLLGDDGSALSRRCNDMRFWLAWGVLELMGNEQKERTNERGGSRVLPGTGGDMDILSCKVYLWSGSSLVI